jgi:hypothetical protein
MADVTAPFGFPYPENTDLVRDGAQDIENLATGVNDQLALGYLYVGTRYYTSSGTFAKADPFGDSSFDGAKLRAIRVRCVGGGGGGNGVGATSGTEAGAGGGGAGGNYCESFITDVAGLPSSVTVTRGAGGSGGVGSANGANGGDSSFDALVVARGGRGASFCQVGAVGIAIAVGADAQLTGNVGQLVVIGGDGVGTAPSNLSTVVGGKGGGTFLAGSRRGIPTLGGSETGLAGQLPGGGGSGAANAASQTSKNGGAGANGIVIIDVFS